MSAMASDEPLQGVRVVESVRSLAGAYAGFLLAELGADVHAAQPAGGPVLDRRKRAAAAPSNVDAVLHDADAPAIASAAPVRCSLSAWGERGPRRHLPPDEALLAAATGVQSLQWSWSGRPVWMVTPMIGYMTGILAALGTTAALLGLRRGLPSQELRMREQIGPLQRVHELDPEGLRERADEQPAVGRSIEPVGGIRAARIALVQERSAMPRSRDVGSRVERQRALETSHPQLL